MRESLYVEVMNTLASICLAVLRTNSMPGDSSSGHLVTIVYADCVVGGSWLADCCQPGGLCLAGDPLRSAGPGPTGLRARDYRTPLLAARDYLKRRPADRRAVLMAARCLTRMGQKSQAEEFYRRCGPLELNDLQDRAYGLVLMGQPERAAEIYYEIIQRWPEDVLALKRLAAVLMELKEWKEALLVSERLIQIPAGEVAGRTLAGIGFHVSKHADQAVTSFERVLQLDPDLKEMPLPQPLFWNHMALELIALGRSAEARGYLRASTGQPR